MATAPAGAHYSPMTRFATIDLTPEIDQLPRRSGYVALFAREREESITYHYSAVEQKNRTREAELATLLAEARYHLKKNWGRAGKPPVYGDGMMYDEAVLSDGTRVILRRRPQQLWHTGNDEGNASSIAIHSPLGPGQDLTEPQRESLYLRFDELRAERSIPRDAIYGHNEWPRVSGAPSPAATYRLLSGQSECPGPVLHRHLVAYRALAVTGDAYTKDSPILGAPRATLAHAIRYVLARPHGGYTTWDIAQVILPSYFDQCAELGVDPIVAIAQMIHETGNLTSYWSQRPRRNPAGIGVDGTPGKGNSFADWTREAIPAHLGRLLAYALPLDAPTSLAQEAAIRYALRVRPLDKRARGSASTLDPLGAADNPVNRGLPRKDWIAGWAWDGEQYGEALARTATAICEVKL